MSRPVILVAVDLPHADEICRGALPVAQAMHARLVLLHVLKGAPASPRSRLDPVEGEDAARQALAPACALLAEHLDVELVLIRGEVVKGIWDYARQRNAIMIVVGSDITTNMIQTLQGSFTRSVLRAATSPVLVIPTRELGSK
ncbi:MAG: universal stress protein [Myxococcota bacterium]